MTGTPQLFKFSAEVYCDRETAEELKRVLEVAANALFDTTTENASAAFHFGAERVVIAAQRERDAAAA